MSRFLISAFLCLCLFSTNTWSQKVYKSQAKNSSSLVKTKIPGERDYSRFSTDNIIYSGNLNLGFTNNIFSFGLGPIIGYKFNDYFSAGLSVGYNYSRWGNYNHLVDLNGNYHWKPLRYDYYNGGVWARISPIDQLYAHVEYEHNILVQKHYYYDDNYNITKFKTRMNSNSLLVGLGYKQSISDRVSYCYTVLYDVLQNSPSNMYTDPYSGEQFSLSPYAGRLDIRVGIYFNF